MNKKKIVLFGASLALACSLAFVPSHAVGVFAEDSSESEPIVSSSDSQEIPAESSSEESAQEPSEKAYLYSIKDAHIRYRNSEEESYAEGDAKIGLYYLSADGWNDEEEPIVMTIKGNVSTKIESKVLYIYEYRPTRVSFNGNVIPQREDKTYVLEKPAEEGEYDLAIDFTKTLIVNPTELASINWESLLTVQNLMTIGAWVLLFIAIIAMYMLNVHYKKRGSTTLQEVQSTLVAQIKESFGEQVAAQVNEFLKTVVAPSYDAIVNRVSCTDQNVTTLIRCLLVMQEGTPEARLAVTGYLAKLDQSNDEQAAQVRQIIQNEMDKYKAEQEAKKAKEEAQLKAVEEAAKVNEEWKNKAEASKTSDTDDSADGGVDAGYDGTSI